MASKSKALEYQAAEPAFLRRMKAQSSGQNPDGRHERPIPRPQRVRKDNEEDAPAFVVEGSNETLSKDEYDALLKADADEDTEPPKSGGNGRFSKAGGDQVDEADGEAAERHIRKVKNVDQAALGESKKRKAAKVVGSEDAEPTGNDKDREDAAEPSATKRIAKKKKGKAIKLSFDDEAE